MWKIKCFFKKLHKIWCYTPLLWKDEDWDFEYILDLLEYKLKRTQSCIDKNRIVCDEERAEIVRTIDETLKHIHNYKNAYKIYNQLHKLPFEVGYKAQPLENGYSGMVTINKATQKPLNELEEQSYLKHIMTQHEFEQQEWNLIFDTMKEHGQKWWD